MSAGKSLGLLINRVAVENGVKSPVMVNNFIEDEIDKYSPRNETTSSRTLPPLSGLDLTTNRDDSRVSSRLSSAKSPRIPSPRETPRRTQLNRKAKVNSTRDITSNRTQTPIIYSDFSDSENDDEGENTELQNSHSAFWNGFSDSIKKIHDNTESLFLRPRPNFKSSDSYKEAMIVMYGNSEYNCTRGYTKLKDKIKALTSVTGLASRIFARAAQEKEESGDLSDEVDADDAAQAEMEKKNKMSEIIGAKRGWKLIKRHVNETAKEENTKESKMNWAFLQHHLHNMSNAEKARIDLYERYGLVPVLTEKGTMERKNKMLEEQLRAESFTNLRRENNLLLSNKTGQKRAASARPSYNSNWGKKAQRKQNHSASNINRPVSSKRPTSETVLKSRLSR